ncbi:MAG: tRNA pseudouridine(38-40) synthase TruA [Anaerolineae bacterium]|nr:tRNA pseudouridine(38-40) synthase TruA [Gemmatimonadaceae bacterium]
MGLLIGMFPRMVRQTIQLVLQYDGEGFSGWQRQPDSRTIQGTLEAALGQICAEPVVAVAAGRTDAGVHARGQAVGVSVPERWTPDELRRALNAVLPNDVWVARSHLMRSDFHARYSALSRCYIYNLGTDECSKSPFRRRWEWSLARPLSRESLDVCATALVGDHCFRAFAVRNTAPAHDMHRCTVVTASWNDRRHGLSFAIEANRFLHHMVRFLVGTMIDIASDRRPLSDLEALLRADGSRVTSPPAPARGLFLESIRYESDLYLT